MLKNIEQNKGRQVNRWDGGGSGVSIRQIIVKHTGRVFDTCHTNKQASLGPVSFGACRAKTLDVGFCAPVRSLWPVWSVESPWGWTSSLVHSNYNKESFWNPWNVNNTYRVSAPRVAATVHGRLLGGWPEGGGCCVKLPVSGSWPSLWKRLYIWSDSYTTLSVMALRRRSENLKVSLSRFSVTQWIEPRDPKIRP